MQVFKKLGAISLIFAITIVISCGGSKPPTDVTGELPPGDASDVDVPPTDVDVPPTDADVPPTDTDVPPTDTDTVCIQNCGNRVCGPDPVCELSCGTCPEGQTCTSDGQCVPLGCEEDCSGLECGPDPVCGKWCGDCADNQGCDLEGKCVALNKDCTDGWCVIPAGQFEMGALDDEEPYDFRQRPRHPVTITRSFSMMETEVTQGQWNELVSENPSHHKSCGDNCPVEGINWFEAVYYANALSEKLGLENCYTLEDCSGTVGSGIPGDVSPGAGTPDSEVYRCASVTFKGLDCAGYRLPTEAEWEYAARAGTTEPRYGDIEAIAWHEENSSYKTHPVGTRAANAWGLRDVLGNVFEFAWDWMGANYYSTCATGCTDPLGPDSGTDRVIRGGAWIITAPLVRLAVRGHYAPDFRFSNVGIRLVRTLP